MSRIKLEITITPENIHRLEQIGKSGVCSSGWSQDWQFCLDKAIEEFIKKYESKKW